MGDVFGGKTRALENEVERFFDCISKSALVFKEGIKDYLSSGPESEPFLQRIEQIGSLEHEADELRRDVRFKLYSQMLIPDARGDVLSILENSDNVIDTAKKVLNQFYIEQPNIDKYLHEDFLKLSEATTAAVDEMVKACRAFFKELSLINDFINKVYFYEGEADNYEDQVKKKAFQTDPTQKLSHKIHMRYFAEKVALLSDQAEGVAERLSVYSIKQGI
jgi:predicted phosphate transport protein (TIGR00153 family)